MRGGRIIDRLGNDIVYRKHISRRGERVHVEANAAVRIVVGWRIGKAHLKVAIEVNADEICVQYHGQSVEVGPDARHRWQSYGRTKLAEAVPISELDQFQRPTATGRILRINPCGIMSAVGRIDACPQTATIRIGGKGKFGVDGTIGEAVGDIGVPV